MTVSDLCINSDIDVMYRACQAGRDVMYTRNRCVGCVTYTYRDRGQRLGLLGSLKRQTGDLLTQTSEVLIALQPGLEEEIELNG